MTQAAIGTVNGQNSKKASGNIAARGGSDELPISKKSKISDHISPSPRPVKGGKSIPRKAPPVSTMPLTASPPRKTKNGGKKQGSALATKAPPTPQGKYKSAEIIEDSDEDYGLDASGEDEDNDEFAKMVGESLAADVQVNEEGIDDDEQDDEDEDEDEDEDGEDEHEADELGGARLVVRDEGRNVTGENSPFQPTCSHHSLQLMMRFLPQTTMMNTPNGYDLQLFSCQTCQALECMMLCPAQRSGLQVIRSATTRPGPGYPRGLMPESGVSSARRVEPPLNGSSSSSHFCF